MTATEQALERLKRASIVVADILDAGERDPTWHESQELEEAAIAYGRAVRAEQAGCICHCAVCKRYGRGQCGTHRAYESCPFEHEEF